MDTGVRVDQNCVTAPLIKRLLTEMFQGVVFLGVFRAAVDTGVRVDQNCVIGRFQKLLIEMFQVFWFVCVCVCSGHCRTCAFKTAS